MPPKVHVLRVKLYMIFDEPRSSAWAQAWSIFVLFFIVLSILVFVVETIPESKALVDPQVWVAVEAICTVVFTFEFSVRLGVCDVSGLSVFKFLKNPMNMVDLVAILPFYIWLAFQNVKAVRALGILRTIRLVRLFRIFKLARYSSGVEMMTSALRKSSQAGMVLGFFLGIGIVLFSSLLFYVEKMACPERAVLARLPADDSNFQTQLDQYKYECSSRKQASVYGLCCDDSESPLDFPDIVSTFWWSIVTATTVGFGDVYPRTLLGRFVGTFTMLTGILLIALPVAIIGRKFQEAYEEHMQSLFIEPPPENNASNLKDNPGFLQDMARRLRLMPLGDELGGLARDMADDMDTLVQFQCEISSLEANDEVKMRELIKNFQTMLDYFDDKTSTIPKTKLKSRVTMR